jgi:serine/threonine-protein kinase
MSFIRRLRERRMIQIALSYIGAAWVVMEVIDQFVDRAIVPELLYRIVLIWMLAGVPAALLIAWHHGEKGKQRAPLSEIVVLLLLCLCATGLSAVTVSRQRAAENLKASADNPLEMRRLAVLYFKDETPAASYQYLADGLTESLITELAQVRELSVISRNGSAQFRDSDLDADSIAQLLGVGTVVDGTIDQDGEALRVHLRIVDGQSGQVFRRASFERPSSEILALRDSLTQQAAQMLRAWLGQEIRVREAALSTSNVAAWSTLQRAEKSRKDAEALLRQNNAEQAQQAFDLADSLLARAEQLDAAWPDPSVGRADISYRRARLAQSSPPDAVRLVQSGLAHVEEALRRARNNARALELRGTMNYYVWLLQVTADPLERARLRESAKTDLEAAVTFDPRLAGAHATLSHLNYTDDIANAVVAAQRAYEEDAYLEVANVVLWRLFNGSLELAQFASAQRWCSEGARRFPADYRFVQCQLRLLSTPALEPDINQAWLLLARQDSLTPAPRLAFEHTRGEMIVGGVIGRSARSHTAGTALGDSARAVLTRARQTITPQMDPAGELLTVEAYMRVLADDDDEAIALLERVKARAPEQFTNRTEVGWWWRDLQDHPKFRKLFGLN